jgi:hypothetical protein
MARSALWLKLELRSFLESYGTAERQNVATNALKSLTSVLRQPRFSSEICGLMLPLSALWDASDFLLSLG